MISNLFDCSIPDLLEFAENENKDSYYMFQPKDLKILFEKITNC